MIVDYYSSLSAWFLESELIINLLLIQNNILYKILYHLHVTFQNL